MPQRLVAGLVVWALVQQAQGLELSAQSITVVYDHGLSTPQANRTWYRVAGKSNTATLVMPMPREFIVDRGQAACIQVVHGNPLLYTYAVDTATVGTSNQAQTDFITLFGAAIVGLTPGASAGLRAASKGPGSGPADYVATVGALYNSLQTIEKEVDASDEGDFQESYEAFQSEYGTAKDRNTASDRAWTALDADGRAANEFIRFTQAHVWEAIAGWKTKWDAARDQYGKEMCVPVTATRLKLTLTIKESMKRANKDHGARTLTPDLTFMVESRSRDRVYFSPGLLLSTYIQDKATFRVNAAGVVDSASDHDLDVSPALFAHYRIRSSPLFATFGVGENASSPAFFWGLTFRDDFLGTAVSLGAGFSLLKAPVRLSKGGSGQPIPAGAGDLSDIIEKRYRGGMGIVFSITGLSLEKKDSKQAP